MEWIKLLRNHQELIKKQRKDQHIWIHWKYCFSYEEKQSSWIFWLGFCCSWCCLGWLVCLVSLVFFVVFCLFGFLKIFGWLELHHWAFHGFCRFLGHLFEDWSISLLLVIMTWKWTITHDYLGYIMVGPSLFTEMLVSTAVEPVRTAVYIALLIKWLKCCM